MNKEFIVEGLPSYAEEALRVLQHLVVLRVKLRNPRTRTETYAAFLKEFPPEMKRAVDDFDKAIEFVDGELWSAAKAVSEVSEGRVGLLVAFQYIRQVADLSDAVADGTKSEQQVYEELRQGLLGRS